MRQASRRSWRIGQRLPVQVVYFAYSGTLQAQALALVAKKLQSSLAVEGELVEEGLAAHGDDGEDLLLSLARSLTERVEASEDSLEGLFAGVRQTEQDVESALRPDDLAPEEPGPEPEPMPWSMPEREPTDLTEFVELPLFAPMATATPSGNGASAKPEADEGEAATPQAPAIRRRNLDDALKAGAQAMCYLCPMCRRGLADAARDRGLDGYHIVELARMALGELPVPS